MISRKTSNFAAEAFPLDALVRFEELPGIEKAIKFVFLEGIYDLGESIAVLQANL